MAAIRRRGGRFDAAVALGHGQSLFGATPHLAMNALGDAVVAWRATTTRVLVAYRRGGGRFGAPETLRSSPVAAGLEVRDPAVAIDPHGVAAVAWASSPRVPRDGPPVGADGVRFSQRGRTGRFGTPVIISGPEAAAAPALAAGPGGAVAIAWRAPAPDGGGAIHARVRAPLGAFGGVQEISTPASSTSGSIPPSSAHDPVVAMTRSNQTIVAWAETRYLARVGGFQHVVVAFASPGGPFSRPFVLSNEGLLNGIPQIAVTTTGMAAVVWQERDRVWASMRYPGLVFTAAQPISPNVIAPAVPSVAGGQTLVASWFRARRIETATWSPSVARAARRAARMAPITARGTRLMAGSRPFRVFGFNYTFAAAHPSID
jgi:hypothetical protein